MTTLAQLKTSVDAWLIRDDVAVSGTDWPQILLNTESEIALEYRYAVQESTTTLNFTGQSADLPADYLEARNPFIDDNIRRFEYKTPHAIRQSKEWVNGGVGMSYTIEGGSKALTGPGDDRIQMTIAGPASVSNPLNVLVYYYARFPALVNDTDTNWLLINHFNVYLFEALNQAAIYIQEIELAMKYMEYCIDLRNRMAKNENRKRYGAVPKQSYGSPRTIV
jgi:hypothetical protein